MAANDWADRDLDAVERPERPIPSGRVGARSAVGVAIGLTAAGLAIAARAAGVRGLAIAVPLAAAVWTYDLWAKNTAAGPAVMASCRALDVLLGASTGNLRSAAGAAAVIGAHTYTLTELSRREVSGGRPGLAAATLAATAGLAGAVTARRTDPVTVGLAGLYAARYGRAQARILTDPGPSRFRAAVAAGIVELPTLQGALAGRAGSARTGLAVAAAAPLARMLTRKVSAT
jgi:4-hydroxybenzoate polyprenyltransferase